MKIVSIEMVGVMSHANTKLELPETGVVLITGRNGSGKSAFIEAVSMGLYGETLRGKSCWNPDFKKAEIRIRTDTLEVFRAKTGSRTKLEWRSHGEEPIAYETATKAQDALEEQIIPAHVWRRVGVISSADATYFTIAPDQERKRLLEDILGLNEFDQIAEKARAKRVAAASALEDSTRKARQLEMSEAALSAKVAEAKEAVDEGPPTDRTSGELLQERNELKDERRIVRERLVQAESDLDEKRAANAAARAEAEAAKRRAEAVEAGVCEACGAPVGADAAEAARHALAHAKSLPTYDVTGLREEIDALRQREGELTLRVSKLGEELDALAQYKSRMKNRTERIRAMEFELLDLSDELDVARAEVSSCEADLAEYRSVERILSTRGIRSVMLAEALSVVEDAANRWLQFVPSANGAPLELKLTAYTEKKGGGLSDALSLDVINAGAGHGYRAASGGERRRIDLAIMLALQEIAEAAHGVDVGTVFVDEAFDALDAAVIPEAVEMLEDLASTKCVVLITHNENVVTELSSVALHVNVSGGTIEVV